MPATIIDGKQIAQDVRNEVKQKVSQLAQNGIVPCLAVILVGENPASVSYVTGKQKALAEVGMKDKSMHLPESTTQEELLKIIKELNEDSTVHGILVQLPLPKHIDDKAVIDCIDPKKDVDAFNVNSVGKIMIGNFDFVPCTPAGVMELLDQSGIDVASKDCVVIGRSNIVGKPQAMLMLHKNATVTIAHSKTKDLKEKTKNADIVVASVGKAGFLTADMVKEGAVVIDVGINRDENGKLCGDVDFENVAKKASYITPVPGGVGPMTITMLMKNTLTAAMRANNIED